MTDRSAATRRSTPQGAQDGPSITLAEAQAAANELAARYTTDQTLTPAERSNLVEDLRDATMRVRELKRAEK